MPKWELNPGRIATAEYSNHYPTERLVTPIVVNWVPSRSARIACQAARHIVTPNKYIYMNISTYQQ